MTLYDEVREALRDPAFRPRKRLGQNFLIHERVIDAILRLLDLSQEDEVLEVGPGLGFLTRRLVALAGKVYAVEVDPFLVHRLKQSTLALSPRLELIHDDILNISLDELLPAKKIKLAANLPYSISTPVFFRLLQAREHFSSLVLMVQKEVADRIASGPGTKSYGTLSVWCQVHGRVAAKVPVAPEAFSPRPKVRSTVLKIDLLPVPRLSEEEIPLLRDLLRAAFGQRRKTLSNTMTAWLKQNREAVEGFLRLHQIDPKRRGETLTVDEFAELSRALSASGLLPARLDAKK
ncbi:MAG: 16S rRNA (adenine(1518)-N(6)/adenine(1519)-N(6))-dimethyltransferase RsmA [Candidatus Binatia bacterium]